MHLKIYVHYAFQIVTTSVFFWDTLIIIIIRFRIVIKIRLIILTIIYCKLYLCLKSLKWESSYFYLLRYSKLIPQSLIFLNMQLNFNRNGLDQSSVGKAKLRIKENTDVCRALLTIYFKHEHMYKITTRCNYITITINKEFLQWMSYK